MRRRIKGAVAAVYINIYRQRHLSAGCNNYNFVTLGNTWGTNGVGNVVVVDSDVYIADCMAIHVCMLTMGS